MENKTDRDSSIKYVLFFTINIICASIACLQSIDSGSFYSLVPFSINDGDHTVVTPDEEDLRNWIELIRC